MGIGEVKGIILDRDGTLVDVVRDEETGAIGVAFHPAQLRILPGVVDGLVLLRDAGFVFAMATNQPGPAKGQYSGEAVRRTNDALVALLAKDGIAIADVRACLHHPSGGPGGDASLVRACGCRKPKSGLLDDAIAALGLDRTTSWMVGDSTSDIEAGTTARLRTALVFASNRCELCPLRSGPASLRPTVHGATLRDVARAILAA